MSERKKSFELTKPPRIDISARSGDVIVAPSSDGLVTVVLSGSREATDEATIDGVGGKISIRTAPKRHSWFSRGIDVSILTPPGGTLRVGIGSGDVVVRVPMESLDIKTGSGDVRLDRPAGSFRATVGSGDVDVEASVDDAVVSSASGDISFSMVDKIVAKTASGSVNLDSVNTRARVTTASGDVQIRRFAGVSLTITTMSGNSDIGLVPGMKVSADISAMSGEFRNQIEPSQGQPTQRLKLAVKSFSGDVTLRSPW